MEERAGRAVGYPRVSTAKQAEKGYSLPEQVEQIRGYCAQHGYPLVDMITDDFTGSILERPGLSRVTTLAQSGGFDVLVCVKLDRLARKNHIGRAYEEQLRERGIRVEYVEQRFEDSASGRLQRNILGSIAEYQYEDIRKVTMDGRRSKAQTARVMPCYAPTFGYHQISRAEAEVIPEYTGASGAYLVNPEEAALVGRMFQLYAGGRSLRGLAILLNEEGHRTRQGNPWTMTAVRYVLKNEAYIGRPYFGRKQSRITSEVTEHGNIRHRRRLAPREEWVELVAPRIVDDALFHAVQAQLRENADRLVGRPSRLWPLAGSIFCAECKRMNGSPRACYGEHSHTRQNGREVRRYRCNARLEIEPGKRCGIAVMADVAEARALAAVRRMAEPGRLAQMERLRAERARKAADPHTLIPRLQAELATLDAQERLLLDRALSAPFSDHIVAEKVAAMTQRRKALNVQLAALQAEPLLPSPDVAASHAEAAAERLRVWLEVATENPAHLQAVFRACLTVTVCRDKSLNILTRVPRLGEIVE